MNVSHLPIKFAVIVKCPLRPHLRLEHEDRATKSRWVGSPEVIPEPGAFKHVSIRQ
jgi:hypothetical protein